MHKFKKAIYRTVNYLHWQFVSILVYGGFVLSPGARVQIANRLRHVAWNSFEVVKLHRVRGILEESVGPECPEEIFSNYLNSIYFYSNLRVTVIIIFIIQITFGLANVPSPSPGDGCLLLAGLEGFLLFKIFRSFSISSFSLLIFPRFLSSNHKT